MATLRIVACSHAINMGHKRYYILGILCKIVYHVVVSQFLFKIYVTLKLLHKSTILIDNIWYGNYYSQYSCIFWLALAYFKISSQMISQWNNSNWISCSKLPGSVSGIGNARLSFQQNSRLVTSWQRKCMRAMHTPWYNYEYELKLTEIVSNICWVS